MCARKGVGRPHVRRPLTSFEHPSIRLNSSRAVETPAIYRLTNTFNETTPTPPTFSRKITRRTFSGRGGENLFDSDKSRSNLSFYRPDPSRISDRSKDGEEYRPSWELSKVKSRESLLQLVRSSRRAGGFDN